MSNLPVRASTTGDRAHASTTGDRAHASTTGYYANASTTGDYAHASTTGYYAHASTTGYYANASTTGDGANASTAGDRANASTAGYGAHAFALGKAGRAVAHFGAAACGPGGCIVIGYADAAGRRRIAVGYEGEDVEAGVAYEADRDGRLVPVGKVLLVDDGRGYTVLVKDGVYIAGCRSFTLAEARSHWGNPAHHAPQSAAAILAAIEAHAASETAS